MTSIIQRMNTSNAKDYLPFVQAMADKKAVQLVDSNGRWHDLVESSFACPPSNYRIKPEPRKPRERWINVYAIHEVSFSTRELADSRGFSDRLECVHYKEVIDEQ